MSGTFIKIKFIKIYKSKINKSNLLFEKLQHIVYISSRQLMHSVSAKDKDLTVIRILYRHLYWQFIQTHKRTKNMATVGMWFYITDL